MSCLAIIPARGGSKRIHLKNIKPFLGKPIIQYSIEAAVESSLFDEIIVSTDNDKIAAVSKEAGAKVPFKRSIENSDDFAPLNNVFLEVQEYYKNQSKHFDDYCIILPTSPLLTADLLIKGYDFIINSRFDSVRPVVRFNYPIQRAYKLINEKVEFLNPEYAKTRSQDLIPTYHDVGMFYFIKNNFDLTGNNKGAFEIDPIYAQDIDNKEDWRIAEFKYQYLHKFLTQ